MLPLDGDAMLLSTKLLRWGAPLPDQGEANGQCTGKSHPIDKAHC